MDSILALAKMLNIISEYTKTFEEDCILIECENTILKDLTLLEIIKKYENVSFIKEGNTFKIILSSEKITQEEQNKVRDGLVND